MADDLSWLDPDEVAPLDPGDLPMLLVGAVVTQRLEVSRLAPRLATSPKHIAIIEALRAVAARGEVLDVLTIAAELEKSKRLKQHWRDVMDYIEWWTWIDPLMRSVGMDIDATLDHLCVLAIARMAREYTLLAAAATEKSEAMNAVRLLERALDIAQKLSALVARAEAAE